jgi:hypothetical protein
MVLATAWNELNQIIEWVVQDTEGTFCSLVKGHNPKINVEEPSKTMLNFWTEM